MNRLNIGHYVIGMEGVALLRTWLGGKSERVQNRIRELTQFVTNPQAGPLAVEVEVPEKNCHEGYAAWATTYDSLPNALIRLEEPAVRGLIDQLPPGPALDAACGTGRHTAYLAARGHRVVGVDASVEMLEKARNKLPTVEFRTGDLTHLPLETGSVDLAVCALALSYCTDLAPPVQELARVVRPGGRVLLSDFHPVMMLLGGAAFFVAGDGSFGHVTSYFHPHSTQVAAFKAVGLSIEQCLEPRWGQEEILLLLRTGGLGGIADEAFSTAWLGMPGVLIWELVRQA
jgi:ubiquinone/menaquinone biosynthesis C-methylase UbiE